MPTPNAMPKISADERAYRAFIRELELDDYALSRGRVTDSKAYAAARAKAGIRR